MARNAILLHADQESDISLKVIEQNQEIRLAPATGKRGSHNKSVYFFPLELFILVIAMELKLEQGQANDEKIMYLNKILK